MNCPSYFLVLLLLLLLLWLPAGHSFPPQLSFPLASSAEIGIPKVKDVSAMCNLGGGGITASIEFDRPFSGRIYSIGFDSHHECVYFNGFGSTSVLFSIPINGCGTRHSKNTREVIDLLENRVYVQVDKYTLNSFDKKYAFVCELAPTPLPYHQSAGMQMNHLIGVEEEENVLRGRAHTKEIRRHPSLPSNGAAYDKATQPIRPVNGMGGGAAARPVGLQPIIPSNAPPDYSKHTNWLYYGGGGREWTATPPPIDNTADWTGTTFSDYDLLPASTPRSPFANPFYSPTSNLEKEIGDLNSGTQKGPEERSTTTSTTTLATSTSTHWSLVPLFTTSTTSTLATPIISPVTTAPHQSNDSFSINVNKSSLASEPIRLLANQQQPMNESSQQMVLMDRSIFLEILKGDEPSNSSRLDGQSVKIGEPIVLVVHGRAASRDPNQWNIFVHSCYSSDGTEATHIQLIDSGGCSVHSQVIGRMQRRRRFRLDALAGLPIGGGNGTSTQEDEIIYCFAMKAFKFPSRSDVYFFCSVDIAPDINFPEICPGTSSKQKIMRRDLPGAMDGGRDARLVENKLMVEMVDEMGGGGEEGDGAGRWEEVKGSLPGKDSVNRQLIFIIGCTASLAILATSALFLLLICRRGVVARIKRTLSRE